MYERFRIIYSDETPQRLLGLFADAVDRLKNSKEKLRASDLPTILKR